MGVDCGHGFGILPGTLYFLVKIKKAALNGAPPGGGAPLRAGGQPRRHGGARALSAALGRIEAYSQGRTTCDPRLSSGVLSLYAIVSTPPRDNRYWIYFNTHTSHDTRHRGPGGRGHRTAPSVTCRSSAEQAVGCTACNGEPWPVSPAPVPAAAPCSSAASIPHRRSVRTCGSGAGG